MATNKQVLEAAFESAEKRKGFFFEPESRLQLVEKLRHLSRFSDFLLLITGPEGAGKSTLLDQLVDDEADTTLRSCRLSGVSDLSSLLRSMAQQLVPGIDPSEDDDQLVSEIYQSAAMMAQEHIQWVVMVDDAERLNGDALAFLLGLLSDVQGVAVKPHLMLLGAPELQLRLQQEHDFDLFEGQTHHLELLPFSEQEANSYLLQRYSAAESLSEKQLYQVVQTAGGYPGRLNAAVESLFRSGSVSAPRASGGLPKLHLVSIVVVLLGVLAISLWQYWPSGDGLDDQDRTRVQLEVPIEQEKVAVAKVTEPVSEIAVNKPASFTHEEEDKVSQVSAEDEATVTESPAAIAISEPIVTESRVPVQVQSKSNKAPETVTQVAVNESSESTPQPVVKQVQPKAEPAKPKPEPVKVAVLEAAKPSAASIADSKALLAWPKSSYTLQVLGAAVEKSARDFIRAQEQPQKFYMFTTSYKGKPWFVVIYGQYKDRNAAVEASKNLPQTLRELRPWARSVQGIQADLQ